MKGSRAGGRFLKGFGRRVLTLVCLLALLQPSALADLKRGNSGDEVVQLQQQLIDVGALDDQADGKFGKKTEKAVKDLQAYFGQKKTGRADKAFMDELSILWYTLQEEEIASNQYSEEEMEEQGLYCYPTEAETEYCPRHEFLGYLEGLLKKDGRAAPAGVQSRIRQRIVLLGYREILSMYDQWEEKADEEKQEAIREEKEKFVSGFESVFGVIENYELKKSWVVPMGTWEDMTAWVMLPLVNLCDDMHRKEEE